MKHRKGYSGRNNKKNDQKLIERIKNLLNSENYAIDHMTDQIEKYVARYDKICSLTDKMRYHMKVHIELHLNEFDEDKLL